MLFHHCVTVTKDVVRDLYLFRLVHRQRSSGTIAKQMGCDGEPECLSGPAAYTRPQGTFVLGSRSIGYPELGAVVLARGELRAVYHQVFLKRAYEHIREQDIKRLVVSCFLSAEHEVPFSTMFDEMLSNY